MLDLDLEGEDPDFDADGLIERVLAAGPDDEVIAREAAAHAKELPEFAALAESLVHGFLLCAVLDDVSRRRVIKFAYDEPIARPGRWSHFYVTPGCTRGRELPRAARRPRRDAGAQARG